MEHDTEKRPLMGNSVLWAAGITDIAMQTEMRSK